MRFGGEQGTVTAFVTIMTVALLMSIGLVLDGGQLLAAQREAAGHAAAAARAGAQAVDTDALRHRRQRLEGHRAASTARSYLSAEGLTGEVRISGDSVHVVVTRSHRTQLLSLVGIRSVTVTATGNARIVRGVSRGET